MTDTPLCHCCSFALYCRHTMAWQRDSSGTNLKHLVNSSEENKANEEDAHCNRSKTFFFTKRTCGQQLFHLLGVCSRPFLKYWCFTIPKAQQLLLMRLSRLFAVSVLATSYVAVICLTSVPLSGPAWWDCTFPHWLVEVGFALLRIDLCFPELRKGARTWSSQGGLVEDEGIRAKTAKAAYFCWMNTSIYHRFFKRMPVFGFRQPLPDLEGSISFR
jgi:hypothetical protein